MVGGDRLDVDAIAKHLKCCESIARDGILCPGRSPYGAQMGTAISRNHIGRAINRTSAFVAMLMSINVKLNAIFFEYWTQIFNESLSVAIYARRINRVMPINNFPRCITAAQFFFKPRLLSVPIGVYVGIQHEKLHGFISKRVVAPRHIKAGILHLAIAIGSPNVVVAQAGAKNYTIFEQGLIGLLEGAVNLVYPTVGIDVITS